MVISKPTKDLSEKADTPPSLKEEKLPIKLSDYSKQKKILFVHLSVKSFFSGINIGIASLAPIIKKNAHQVSVICLEEELTSEEFKEMVEEEAPSIIGFSATSTQLMYLDKYSKAVHSMPGLLKIAGGVGPSIEPDYVIENCDIDGLVIGEAEIPLDKLLKNLNKGLDITGINGFYWNKDGRVIKNQRQEFANDISIFDFPDYTIYKPSDVYFSDENHIRVMLSRGCPYDCYYCCNNTIKGVYPTGKGYYRVYSVEYSIEFLKTLKSQYPETGFIEFDDDLLIANKKWFLRFAKEYKKHINIPYGLCVRVEAINEEVVEALKESGCIMVYMGLENGNEEYRRKYLNRRYTNDMFIEKAEMVRRSGIKLFSLNMMALPFETAEQMADTLELNKKIEADNGICYFFYPIPKTYLHNLCIENDLLPDEMGTTEYADNYNIKPCIKMSQETMESAIQIQSELTEYFTKRSTPEPLPEDQEEGEGEGEEEEEEKDDQSEESQPAP